MPIPTPCSIGEILEAARLVLVSAGVFTDSQTFLTLDPDDVMLAPPASPICGVTFTAFNQRSDSIHSESDSDSPEDVPTMEGELVCSLWIRIALDKDGRDQHFLLANTTRVRGASILIDQVANALSNEPLTNEDGEQITWHTLDYTGFRNRGKWRQDKNWRRIDVRFNLTFNQKLIRTEPTDIADYFQVPYYPEPLFPKPLFV